MTAPTTTTAHAVQEAAGTWFDGFMIGVDKEAAAARLRSAVRQLFNAFDTEPDAADPINDAEKVAFVTRTVTAIVVEEVHRRAKASFEGEFPS